MLSVGFTSSVKPDGKKKRRGLAMNVRQLGLSQASNQKVVCNRGPGVVILSDNVHYLRDDLHRGTDERLLCEYSSRTLHPRTRKHHQEILSERKIQSYDFAADKHCNNLIGLDKTKIKLVLLKKPSPKYKHFVETKGRIYPDEKRSWMVHVGSGVFEVQYAWQEKLISAGTELGQHSVFAFGPALLSAEFPEHVPAFSNEMRSGFGKLVERLNEECGDVAPWKWDVAKAVRLVCWAMKLIGETDSHLNGVLFDILDRGNDAVDSQEEDGGDDDYDEEDDEDEDDE